MRIDRSTIIIQRDVMKFLKKCSVVILEGSSVHQELLESWISGVTTKAVSSTSELSAELDPTVVVICLSQSVLEKEEKSIQRCILSRNPYCQLIGVLSRSAEVRPFEEQFDEILHQPVAKEEFQQTIESRFIAGVYSKLLRDLHKVNIELIKLRQASGEDIEKKQERINTVQSRQGVLDDQLEFLQERLSQETVVSILRTIEHHKKYLKEPDQERDREESGQEAQEGNSTRYRPRQCPGCKLAWGVDHHNNLGNGYKRLGAEVYQCARCGKIIRGLEGDQRVF